MNENSTEPMELIDPRTFPPTSDAIHLECGVLIFKDGVRDFLIRNNADVLFLDHEDGQMRTYAIDANDWKDVPTEEDDQPLGSVVPWKPKP